MLGARMKWALLLFVVVTAVYAPAVRNGFIYDDQGVFLNQPDVRSASDLYQVFRERHFPDLPYYRPVTKSSLVLQKTIHGANAAPFHLFNALLAGAAAALALVLLRSERLAIEPGPAFAAAAIFGLHPIASSCVYPIASGRETLMPAVWTLLAVVCHLRAGSAWRAGAGLAFAAALFSREQAVVIPVLFVLADLLALSEDPPRDFQRWALRYAPVALLLGFYFVVRHVLFGGQEWEPGSIAGPFWALLYALQTIVAPFVELHYEPTRAVWLSGPRLAVTALVVAALAFAAARARPGKRGWFWSAWFVLALLPTANLLKQEALFDERYAFLASLGFLAFAASVVPRGARWPAAAGLALAGVCALISFRRAGSFRDDIAFSTQWLATNPESVNALFALGFARGQLGDSQGAIPCFEKVLELQPDSAYAHNNLGSELLEAGRRDEALEHFRRALEILPDYPEAHLNVGLILAKDAD